MKTFTPVFLIACLVSLTGCEQPNQESVMSDPTPQGIPTIVPYLYLNDLPKFVTFAETGLGAVVNQKTRNEKDELFYATIQFNNGAVFAQEADEAFPPTPSVVYYYVPDVDAAYQRAIDAGAKSVSEPETHYHGDRNAVVKDAWGNQWFLALNEEDHLSNEEVESRKKSGQE